LKASTKKNRTLYNGAGQLLDQLKRRPFITVCDRSFLAALKALSLSGSRRTPALTRRIAPFRANVVATHHCSIPRRSPPSCIKDFAIGHLFPLFVFHIHVILKMDSRMTGGHCIFVLFKTCRSCVRPFDLLVKGGKDAGLITAMNVVKEGKNNV
jgi:hypothetical protein